MKLTPSQSVYHVSRINFERVERCIEELLLAEEAREVNVVVALEEYVVGQRLDDDGSRQLIARNSVEKLRNNCPHTFLRELHVEEDVLHALHGL